LGGGGGGHSWVTPGGGGGGGGGAGVGCQLVVFWWLRYIQVQQSNPPSPHALMIYTHVVPIPSRAPGSMGRGGAALLHVLRTAASTEGHTQLPWSELVGGERSTVGERSGVRVQGSRLSGVDMIVWANQPSTETNHPSPPDTLRLLGSSNRPWPSGPEGLCSAARQQVSDAFDTIRLTRFALGLGFSMFDPDPTPPPSPLSQTPEGGRPVSH
jgi:hypothetical protein